MWAVLPASLLVSVGLPSMPLLYACDTIVGQMPALAIQVTGNQWFWAYAFSNLATLTFDTYIKPADEISLAALRNFDVDNRVLVPFLLPVRWAVSSSDVIHS